MKGDTFFQVEAVVKGETHVLVDLEDGRLFMPARPGLTTPMRFETPEEAFEAAGRYCTDWPSSPYNPLVFKYTEIPQREQVR